MAKQEINIQAPLMRLIDDDGVILREQWLALSLGEQNAIGHQFDVSFRTGPVVKADLTTHLPSPSDIQFVGNPSRYRQRRNATGLSAADFRFNSQTPFEAHFRELCRFPRASFACNYNDLIGANRLHDFIFSPAN